MSTRILAPVGSQRARSYNRQLAEAAVKRAPEGSMSTESSSNVSREAVTQYIIDLIGQDAEIPDLTVDSSLQSQGLDSLKVMSLVFKIEEHYCIVLDEEDADDLRTVGDLAALVVRRIGEES